MISSKVENPTTEVEDGWLRRNDGPYGQYRLYCPHCHRHSGLHKPRPFCPWCGNQVTGDLDKYYIGYEPRQGGQNDHTKKVR